MLKKAIHTVLGTAGSCREQHLYLRQVFTKSPTLAAAPRRHRRVPTKRLNKTRCVNQISTRNRKPLSIATLLDSMRRHASLCCSIKAGQALPMPKTPRCRNGAINLRKSKSKAKLAYLPVDRNELRATLALTPQRELVVYIGRVAVEKSLQALIDHVKHLDEFRHALNINSQYVPPERVGPWIHLLPARRRIGNWLGIAEAVCYLKDIWRYLFRQAIGIFETII